MQSKLNEILPVLNIHIKRYKGFGARDAYKFLYQACLGPEHLIENEMKPWECFEKEWGRLDSDSSIPLIESLTCDSSIRRINLAPAKASNLDRKKIFKAFTESAREFSGSINMFIDCWQELIRMSQSDEIPLDIEDMIQIDNLAREKGYPPMRHSDEYREKNNPSYRVVIRSVLFRVYPELKDIGGAGEK